MATEAQPHEHEIGIIRYPWEAWCNENTWTAWRGEDYSVSSRSFQSQLYNRAEILGMSVETRTVVVGDGHSVEGVRFRFYPTQPSTSTKE